MPHDPPTPLPRIEAGSTPQPVLGQRDTRCSPWPLHQAAAARTLEKAAAAQWPSHTLMRRAGLGLARLALALTPHARDVWVVCGPGNNGGDGFEVARHLHLAGRQVHLTFHGEASQLPADAAASWQRALAAGVPVHPPGETPSIATAPGLVIDALLGRGLSRPAAGALAEAIAQVNRSGAPVLAVDLPSGLPCNTGALRPDTPCVQARWTLALLSLPPGLFTAQGRDVCGEIWWDDLGIDPLTIPADAWLASGPALRNALAPRTHAQHKGSFGDLWVVGGAPGMTGAPLLAARAALGAGAGRVYLAPLHPGSALDGTHPELMHAETTRLLSQPAQQEKLAAGTVVAGCGGGTEIAAHLSALLQHAGRLVLDADGLNAVAADPTLRQALQARPAGNQATVLTPHPLEAARLLGCDAAQVQQDRLRAAQALAEELRAIVVLKGSGSVVACPQQRPWIMPVGNAALGTPGSGDVLAGALGGWWSQWPRELDAGDAQRGAWQAARYAVWCHGRCAEQLRPRANALPASTLAEALGDWLMQ